MELHWEGWTAGYGWAFTSLVLHTIICLLMLVVFGIYIHIFCIQRYKGNTVTSGIENKFCITLLVSILLGLIVVFGNYWVSNALIVIFDIRFENHCFYRNLLSAIPIYTQRCILYSFLVFRLKIVFQESILAISGKFINGLLISIIVALLTLASLQVYFSYTHHDFRCSNSRALFYNNIVAGLVDIISSLSLSYLFIYKLNQLIKLDVNIRSDNSTQLRRVTNKLTILTNVAVISSLLMLACVAVAFFSYPMSSLDIVINNTCMLLTFSALERHYIRICCCCIRCQNKCFGISTTKDELYDVKYSTELAIQNRTASRTAVSTPDTTSIISTPATPQPTTSLTSQLSSQMSNIKESM